MKTVIFTEDQLHDLSSVGEALFCDEHDPRSSAYVRDLKRPSINWCKMAVYIVSPVLSAVLLALLLKYLGCSGKVAALVVTAAVVLYIILTFKQAMIFAIKLYQRYAPDFIRNKCRFEPSCSEYMILAIEKYGLIKGIHMGIDRLRRCNIDGGGFDFP